MKKNDLESYILDSFAFSAKNIVNSIFAAFYSGAQTKPNTLFREFECLAHSLRGSQITMLEMSYEFFGGVLRFKPWAAG